MKKGFTLIELMVVIAIIALLTAIILTNLTGSKAKSRDTQRASDLAQIQLSIEQYFDRCNQYPTTLLSTGANTGCPSGVTLGNFISKIPLDPTNTGVYVYGYATNSTYTDYVLYITFEATNSVVAQSASNPSWFLSSTFNCADATHFHYCVRPN
jgi:prepilin-type N-terminal cleavage/methylation domain-containing protein